MLRALCTLFLYLALAANPAIAEPVIPNLWDTRERLSKPEIGELPRLRFLTTIDFPPFNFLDRNGRLSGFHVDLARAICAELSLEELCQIQALPWDELSSALEAGQGEAILAGLAVTTESRRRYAFSRPYLRLPARFVAAKDKTVAEPLHETLAAKRVGVRGGSVHEKILRELFPDLRPVIYSRSDWMLDDVRQGKTDAAFADGMALSFWLSGSESQTCCRFVGGPYLLPAYLGPGMAIATRRGMPELAAAFDYALHEINANGTFAELYLRYFPVSFF
ncbi:transporter substrate-binding domain-containing protein [Nitratireductor sp. CAU 1489]|uniref:Transporter substrate-binding domain-containing protein n=1 Tax=Nitratireductor arenosus TaxID=2682096 RepID=A0A844QKW2_9HYPH|nr:transporter substrate-binding domain-containing protein [Nitratireductor arenosus]MVA98531.1 transporter substrate-binding domain-containing protein [Nitratireductor arenosus]